MDEEKTKSDGVPISIGTVIVGLLLYTILLFGVGVAVGFYGGVQNSQSGQIATLCSQLSDSYKGQVAALNETHSSCKTQLERYETFLVSTELAPTMTLNGKSRKGQGGP